MAVWLSAYSHPAHAYSHPAHTGFHAAASMFRQQIADVFLSTDSALMFCQQKQHHRCQLTRAHFITQVYRSCHFSMLVFLKKGRLCHYSRPLRLGLRCLLGRLLFVAVGRGYLLAPRGRSLRSLPARSHSLARGEPARFAALRCAARVCFLPHPRFYFLLGRIYVDIQERLGMCWFPSLHAHAISRSHQPMLFVSLTDW